MTSYTPCKEPPGELVIKPVAADGSFVGSLSQAFHIAGEHEDSPNEEPGLMRTHREVERCGTLFGREQLGTPCGVRIGLLAKAANTHRETNKGAQRSF